ncbi:MAG: thiamine phosphate synthase [Gemmatimonadota bacterium]|nr:thiamine phosphate synthase [Gemmatimonadota bacterium]MDH5758071.1 thiamine phosphate synthase [Gemmatimonadota bacterium]
MEAESVAVGSPPRLAAALRLMVITDGALAHPRTVLDVVREALAGGATAVQLRNKGDSARDLLRLGDALRETTREAGRLLIVNDRVDIALAIGADGVHLGPRDITVPVVRQMVPREFIIGSSADDPAVARALVAQGADYIGCGTIFPTTTKRDAGDVVGIDGLRRMVDSVPVPVVAIGGITPARAPQVRATGVAGIAVVGAVMAATDPRVASRRLVGE